MRIVAAFALLSALVAFASAGSPVQPKASTPPWTGREQWEPARLTRPNFTVTTNRNGLPQSRVSALAFDRQGFLWVGTEDGAAMTGDSRWSVVNMPNRTVSNYVRAIHSDADGAVWFGTREAGVSRLLHGEWTTFTVDAGLPSNRIRAIAETSKGAAEHQIWAATDDGLAIFDGAWWHMVPLPEGVPSDGIQALFEFRSTAAESSLWVATTAGVAHWSSTGWKRFTTADGLPSDDVTSFARTTDTSGLPVLWAGTRNGIARLDGDTWTSIPSDEMPSPDVRCLCETRTATGGSVLWAGTRAGLARYASGSWRSYSSKDGLPGDTVLSLLDFSVQDGTRSLFVGTLGGLAQLDLGGWSTLDTAAGLPSNLVYAILPTVTRGGDQVLWVGTETGVCRLSEAGSTVFTTRDGLPVDSTLCFYEQRVPSGDHVLWAGTEAGLCRLVGQRFEAVALPPELTGKEIRAIRGSNDANGNDELWIATLGGIGVLSNGAWRTYTTVDGLPSASVLSVAATTARDGSRTWWAATYGGLARLAGDRWETVGATSGFPRGEVISLYVSNRSSGGQVLWVGTGDNGVLRFDTSTPDAGWLALNDGTRPALPNNVIYQICEDRVGRIYLVTNRGVARLTERPGRDRNAPEFDVTTFTTADGLPNNEGNVGASAVDGLGRVWIGTVEGAAVLDPMTGPVSRQPLPLQITHSLLGSGLALTDGSELSQEHSDVIFEYALLDYSAHGTTQFRTQLFGFDDLPSEWSSEPRKEYTRIPPGGYTFQVWARDRNGVVSGPATLSFVVKPSWYRTWWAYGLYALAFVALFYVAIRLRFRALERSKELLEDRIRARTYEIGEKIALVEESERRAREEKQRAIEADHAKSVFLANMSHELRTPLNAILGFVQLMDRDRSRSAEDRENLAVISRSGENLLALILDLLTVSRIESGGTVLEEHAFDLHRLLRGVDEMFGAEAHARGLRLTTDIAPEVPRYVWGDENKLRQTLIKVLGNAVKFTSRGSVALRVTWANDRVSFEIRDTGRGVPAKDIDRIFEPFVQSEPDPHNPQGAGLGLTIARSFVRLMGGSMTVVSEQGRGTLVRFDARLPLASGVELERELRRVVGLADGQKPLRILVVDDVAENRSLMVRMLTSIGLQCREAASAHQALLVWEAWRPDLIWMDTHMPEMDGFEATREIRRREAAEGVTHPAVIVGATTSALDDERAEIFSAGFDDYVVVPTSESAVFDKLALRLGLRYVYESTEPATEPYTSEFNLTPEYLATLPTELRSQLHKAVLEGDVAGAMNIANLVREHDDQLATALRSLIRGYRFDELQELMEQT